MKECSLKSSHLYGPHIQIPVKMWKSSNDGFPHGLWLGCFLCVSDPDFWCQNVFLRALGTKVRESELHRGREGKPSVLKVSSGCYILLQTSPLYAKCKCLLKFDLLSLKGTCLLGLRSLLFNASTSLERISRNHQEFFSHVVLIKDNIGICVSSL